jgi:hypothetical protein
MTMTTQTRARKLRRGRSGHLWGIASAAILLAKMTRHHFANWRGLPRDDSTFAVSARSHPYSCRN